MITINSDLGYDEYLNKTVKILHSSKSSYKDTIHLIGIVERTSSGNIAVKFKNKINDSSSTGVFWYRRSEIKIVDNEEYMEDHKMEGYNKVAVVNLLDDYNKKDYGFALFDEDAENTYVNGLVVVNSRGKDNRVLGIVKEILTKEEYGSGVTAEVIGVVDTFNHDQREAEKQRKAEMKKEKEKVLKELDVRINKIKDMEYYEKRAKELKDVDPELQQLVDKLKALDN